MNQMTKTLLGLLAVLLFLCLGLTSTGLFLFKNVSWIQGGLQSLNPKDQRVAASIAGFTLPPGFGEMTTIDAVIFSAVSFTGDDEQSHIYFFQTPSGVVLGPEDMLGLVEPAQGQGPRSAELHMVEQYTASIRGQKVPVSLSKGEN
jgi:hypothetical protein